jgi:hypothetical protein
LDAPHRSPSAGGLRCALASDNPAYDKNGDKSGGVTLFAKVDPHTTSTTPTSW